LKLRQLAAGVATGYVTKAVQFVATMALVPFLLRPDILGVDDYGRAFALIAYMGIGTVVTAGIRLSFLRSISQAVGDDPDGTRRAVGSLLGSGTVILLVICAGLTLTGFAFEDELLAFVQFPSEAGYRSALLLAMAWMTAENALFLFRGPLMARGAITYVNVVTMAEVLLRVGTLVALLPTARSPIAVYLGVHATFATLRGTAFAGWSLVRAPGDLRGVGAVRLADVWQTVLYSRSITLSEAANFLVHRTPVLLAARYLGATDAGFVAIVINTIQNYVMQILFTVVQPLALPIAARFDPRKISASARSFFYDLEGLYCGAILVVIAALTALAPELIRLWLGDGYEPIVRPAQVMLGGCGFEIVYAVRKSLLVGQGMLPEAMGRILALAILTTVAVWISIVLEGSWAPAVYATGLYLAASNVFGIGVVWSRHFAAPDQQSPGPARFLALLPSFAVAVVASAYMTDSRWTVDLALAGAVLACSIACVATWVLPVNRVGTTIQRLLASMNRDLFGA